MVKKISIIFLIILIFNIDLFAIYGKCKYKWFNFSVNTQISSYELLDQLADECGFSLYVADDISKKTLDKPLNVKNFNNLLFDDILDLLVKENHLFYRFKKSILKVYALETKTYKLDYITSVRTGHSVLNASVNAQNMTTGDLGIQNAQSRSDRNDISVTEEFSFWSTLSDDIVATINSDNELYKAAPPVINQNAGLVTVTATRTQHEKLKRYFDDLQSRLQKQVLIDVTILLVILDKEHTTGIDWSKFQLSLKNDTKFSYVGSGSSSPLDMAKNMTVVNSVNFSMEGLLNFLQSNGNTRVVSNPKVLTMNSQQALITLGDTVWYRIQTDSTPSGSDSTSVT